MPQPVTGRITGIAVDPSDPNGGDHIKFIVETTPAPATNLGTSAVTDLHAADYAGDNQSGEFGGGTVELPYIEQLPHSVGDAATGFEHTQPLVTGRYTLYDHTFELPLG
jgi:hypothetical protein